jgi:hypothetical protein
MWDTVPRGGSLMLHGGGERRVRVGCAVAVTLLGAAVFAAGAATAVMQKGAAAGPTSAGAPSAVHSIGVAFNYDFTKTPACSATVTTACVAHFVVYDISLPGVQHQLFSIAVPPGAAGKTNLIRAMGPKLPFVIGKHRLGVAAVTPENVQSDPSLCQTIVTVGPAN